MDKKEFDFSGFATKSGLKCADGRTIMKDAFKDQHGTLVPLVWRHLHDSPNNVLGHAILENTEEGDVYCYGKFNGTEAGKNAKELVKHGDITSLSIYANKLKEKNKSVFHGAIREVSLVYAGANPGAVIDSISFAHGDGGSYVEDETEVIIYTGLEFEHADEEEEEPTKKNPPEKPAKKEASGDKTVAEVFNTFTEEQKTVVYALIALALEGDTEGDKDDKDDAKGDSAAHAGDGRTIKEVFDEFTEEQKTVAYAMIAYALDESEEDVKHNNEEGETMMKNNVFDQSTTEEKNVLSHEQLSEIVSDAKRFGSLRESFIAHAEEYGFDPIGLLFPDAKYTNQNGPETIKREDTWVTTVLNEATHTPFARIKTVVADITADEARAKGYVTGDLKKEEIIPLMKRVTTPTTIYKKQRLDRDDMIDITDFDVVIWLKNEMRGMLNEELARAVLISDGRSVAEEDKINEQNIRPIALDNDSVYVHRTIVDNDTTTDELIDEFIRSRKYYKGSGVPTLYTSTDLLTEMLLLKDKMGRRLYNTTQELASVLRVSKIVEVEIMNDAKRTVSEGVQNDILGIIVNMKDYTIGADKGGQVAMFDDFDIDYNQYKYLIETRVSGALTRPKSALILERKPDGAEGV